MERDFKPCFKESVSFMGTAFSQGHSPEHKLRSSRAKRTVTPLKGKWAAPAEPACVFWEHKNCQLTATNGARNTKNPKALEAHVL